jgi:hypothetical protein
MYEHLNEVLMYGYTDRSVILLHDGHAYKVDIENSLVIRRVAFAL